jgi:hypothetical protein
MFETPPPAATSPVRRYSAAPHPFVLHPSEKHGTECVLDLTLFGRGNQHLPHLVLALQRAAQEGLGPARIRLSLAAVQQEERVGSGVWRPIYAPGGELKAEPAADPEIPPPPATVRITLETPLRLKRDNQYVGPREFRFGDLFANLLRRTSLLTYFHTDAPLETDFARLAQSARALPPVPARLRWHDWTRVSPRQSGLLKMGGLLGEVDLEMEGLAPFWPYLWLGQWMHAGKGTSMGLGRFAIHALT